MEKGAVEAKSDDVAELQVSKRGQNVCLPLFNHATPEARQGWFPLESQ